MEREETIGEVLLLIANDCTDIKTKNKLIGLANRLDGIRNEVKSVDSSHS